MEDVAFLRWSPLTRALDLVAILDWFSRFVVSWRLDETLDYNGPKKLDSKKVKNKVLKSYATFKADAVKELLKEEKTINQLAAELGVHPTQLKE